MWQSAICTLSCEGALACACVCVCVGDYGACLLMSTLGSTDVFGSGCDDSVLSCCDAS